MRTKLVTSDPSRTRTYVLALEPGDEVMSTMLEFAVEHDVTSARFTAIGAFSGCVIAFFARETSTYDEIRVDEQLEVLALVGNVALYEGAPKVHAHVLLGDPACGVRGGHLLSAQVWPTLEVTLDVHEHPMQRELDPASGLPLLVP